jgi:hypothetical protein
MSVTDDAAVAEQVRLTREEYAEEEAEAAETGSRRRRSTGSDEAVGIRAQQYAFHVAHRQRLHRTGTFRGVAEASVIGL